MTTFQRGALSALDVEECELALEVLVGVLRVRHPRRVPTLRPVSVVHNLTQAEHVLPEPDRSVRWLFSCVVIFHVVEVLNSQKFLKMFILQRLLKDSF